MFSLTRRQRGNLNGCEGHLSRDNLCLVLFFSQLAGRMGQMLLLLAIIISFAAVLMTFGLTKHTLSERFSVHVDRLKSSNFRYKLPSTNVNESTTNLYVFDF